MSWTASRRAALSSRTYVRRPITLYRSFGGSRALGDDMWQTGVRVACPSG